jgi:eukaryotic-like serine/threonine-protein kinase
MADALASCCPRCQTELAVDTRICPTCAFAAAGDTADAGADSVRLDDLCPPALLRDPDPEVIGHYRVLRRIGEGGMGVVFEAQQQEGLRRVVAVKVIRAGLNSREVAARFEIERQALTRMNHPNVAQVFDAGTAIDGRPYFAMEFVDGVPITAFCDQHHLNIRDRVKLFIQVCEAVQHAHQKGVIHRDLKPSNILVTMRDEVAMPKIIDFGVAKATEERLADVTMHTRVHQFIGTPAYMSPEQADPGHTDLDTRTDIYSLGVLLYELLAGVPPFDPKELSRGGFEELRRVLRDVEPAFPSARVGAFTDSEKIRFTQSRNDTCAALIHQLRGDLDWITMKALEKERARRYETANAFAEDLRRHLGNEPVIARPPSRWYRMERFVRRNTGVTIAVSCAVLTLAAAAGVSIWLAVRATRAEARQEELADKAEEAVVELLRARADLYGARGEWTNAAADLKRAIELRIEGECVGCDDADHWDWLRLSALLVHERRTNEYTNLRKLMLKEFGGATDAKTADRIAKAALLLPGTPDETSQAHKLAEHAFAVGRTNFGYAEYFQLTAGLAAYRNGDIKRAKQAAATVLKVPDLDWNIRALSRVQLALAQHAMGETARARTRLNEARKLAEERVPTHRGNLEQNYWQNWWHDWLILQIMLREAEEVIEGKTKVTAP